MKKSLLGLFFFVQSIHFTFSQSISANLGPVQTDAKHGFLISFAGSDENNFYAIRVNIKGGGFSRNFMLEKYNKQLELITSTPFDVIGKQKRVIFNLQTAFILDNKLYAISTLQNLSDKTYKLQATEIDKETLLPTDNQKILAEMSFEDQNRYNVGSFNLDFSSDSSKVLINYIMPYEKGAPEKFGIKVYEKDFSLLWENDIELPYEDQLFTLNSLDIDNQGNVYFLGKVYEKVAKEKRKEEVNYQYHAFKYSSGKSEPFEYIIDSKSNFFNEINFSINEKQEIICFGFYSTKLNAASEGTFFIKLDTQTNKVVKEKLMSFNDYYISKNGSIEKDIRYVNYRFKQFIQNSDGSYTLVAEQFRIETRIKTSTNSSGMPTTSTTYIYHFDNILALKFDKEGSILWIKVVPKSQESTNENGTYMSYAFFQKNNNIYLFFNEPKYMQKGDGEQSKIYKATDKYSLLNGYSIDENGQISEKTTLFDKNETDVVFTPMDFLPISDKQLILFGRAKKVNRFAEIIIE